MLTARQKELLTFIVENNNSFPQEKDGFPKEERRAILKELVRLGVFEKDRPALTNRGICHIIVDCNVPYTEVRDTYKGSFGAASSEEESRVRKAFGDNTDWLNIFFYFKMKKYLEWDHFDETHHIRQIPYEHLSKYNLEMCEAMLNDARIPVDKVLKLYQIPQDLFAKMGIDESNIKDVIKTVRGLL